MRVTLFATDRALFARLSADHERIADAVATTDEATALSADEAQWAENLAERVRLRPPRVEAERASWADLGPVQVDCTGMPGVTFTTSELAGPAMRDGRRLELHLPVDGDVELLRYWPDTGCAPVDAEVGEGEVRSVWEWPLVRGRDELELQAQAWIDHVARGAQRVAAQVEAHNAKLVEVALKAIADRREQLRAHDSFLAGISLPIAPRRDRPTPFTIPPVRQRRTAASELADAAPPVLRGPQLGELYDEILRNIRAIGKSFERTPATYARKGEEEQRDHLLTILNTNFEGAAHAEAFNVSGKTDLLIRVSDTPLFIGECKWWSGPTGMRDAIDQLLGYTSWRDSRLALVIFVRNRGFHDVLASGRDVLGARDEFVSWQPHEQAGELRCDLRWPDDRQREAVLTTMFFHIPRSRGDELAA